MVKGSISGVMKQKTTILFLCTHNSARSQIAEALMNTIFSEYFEAASAGMEATHVNPYVIKVMEELGIDMSHARSKTVSEFRNKQFDYVVTVCDYAKEICPFYPGDIILHQQFPDPSQFTGDDDEILEKVRVVRDQIHQWLIETFKTGKDNHDQCK